MFMKSETKLKTNQKNVNERIFLHIQLEYNQNNGIIWAFKLTPRVN